MPGNFFKCAAFVAEEVLGADAPLARQLSKQCIAFFMKGVGQVPHWFVGRPATARLGMPNARAGFSYASVHKTHAKPDLAKPVPGPFLAAQFAFVPTRNALWNKPVSFNANTFLQRETATYASTEPRFDRYLTLDDGARLPPWKQQVAEGVPLLVNAVRPPQLFGSVSEELIDVGRPSGPVYPVISALQNKRSSTARSMPRSAAGRRRAHPMACKPWRSMIENEEDVTISEMSMLSAREDRIQRLARHAQACSRREDCAGAMRAAYLEGQPVPKRGNSAPVQSLDKKGRRGGESRHSRKTNARLDCGSPVLALL